MGPPDHWADWLIRGRQRGLDARQIRALTGALQRIRNRVLAGARLRRDASVLHASLTMRPNPDMVSYEDAAREVLGSAADDHLAALASA